MTLFPPPPPDTRAEYLRWDLADRIRFDDTTTLCVDADLMETVEGWAWIARVHGYKLNEAALVDPDEPGMVATRIQKGGPAMGYTSRERAAEACETWIGVAVGRVRA